MPGSVLKKFLPQRLKQLIRNKLGVPSQENSLKRIRDMGFNAKTCLDIGAYEGNWAREFKSIFPAAKILMLEGQKEKEPALLKTKTSLLNDVDYHIALLGAEEKNVTFNKYDTASSVWMEHYATGAKIENRKLTTLDQSVFGTTFQTPDFIKIDTQGYELEILKGGKRTLSHAEFILLEVSMLDIYQHAPLAADVMDFMKQEGFVLYDICTIMRRPLDGALYQSDFLFIKEDSKFRQDKRWA